MILQVKITPSSRISELIEWKGGVLRIRIAAPPDKNKANEELISFLADYFDIAKSRIRILSGHTSRLKRIEIDLDEISVLKKLPRPSASVPKP